MVLSRERNPWLRGFWGKRFLKVAFELMQNESYRQVE